MGWIRKVREWRQKHQLVPVRTNEASTEIIAGMEKDGRLIPRPLAMYR